MSKLKTLLDLKGESAIEIVLGKEGGAQYEAVKVVLKKDVEPKLQAYLDGLKLKEQLAKVETVELLGEVILEYVPANIKLLLANAIDGFEELKDHQRVWLYTVFLQSFHNGATGYIETYFQHRAQEIANKKRIIKSSGIIH